MLGIRNVSQTVDTKRISAQKKNDEMVNRRPWMAFIQLHPASGSLALSKGQQCGGAIVNKVLNM